MWILDQNKEGLYFLDHPRKGSLKNLTLDDLELLADMFSGEVTEADEWDLYEDEDLREERA
jgi:hypothetical protein